MYFIPSGVSKILSQDVINIKITEIYYILFCLQNPLCFTLIVYLNLDAKFSSEILELFLDYKINS